MSSITKTSDIPELVIIYNKENNSESSKDNNSKDNKDNNSKGSKDNNSKGSKSEEVMKTEDDNPTSSDNEYTIIYYTALTRNQLYAMTEEENCVCYKECIIY